MTIKKHREICKHCNLHMLIDNECGGDYLRSGVLQWWCPDCGMMKPLLGDFMLSNRKKQKLSKQFAREYNLPFKECQKLGKSILASNASEFLSELFLRTKTLNHCVLGTNKEG